MKHLIFALALMSSVGVRADTVIDTNPSSGDSIVYFGIPETQTYGQTITVPTNGDTVLNSFSFTVNLPTTLEFQGELYAWNGAEATGSNLFESDGLYGTGSTQTAMFDTGGIQLVAGQQYVIFGTSSKLDPGNSGVGSFAEGSTDYSGGEFVYINNGSDPSQWTSTPWNQGYLGTNDLAFTADFSNPAESTPLPTPAASILFLLGGVGAFSFLKGKRVFDQGMK